jgi:DNA-binding SARP family transcriptional activator
VRLRVLAPAVEVEVDGLTVPLSDRQSKLVLALVLAHPSPLHVEQASDALWPDEALAATRPRLSSLVHRVRRALGPHGEALVRAGDLLRLDPVRCHVDLWAFQHGLIGNDSRRKAALLSVRGNLADAQFPYDEGLIEARHQLVAEWLGHAGRARRAGEVDAAELEPVLASLRLAPVDLEQAGAPAR